MTALADRALHRRCRCDWEVVDMLLLVRAGVRCVMPPPGDDHHHHWGRVGAGRVGAASGNLHVA